MGINFLGFLNSMDFTAFSHAMEIEGETHVFHILQSIP